MEEAERLCDRVAIVDHGRVIALGTPRELIASLRRGARGRVRAWRRDAPARRRRRCARSTASARAEPPGRHLAAPGGGAAPGHARAAAASCGGRASSSPSSAPTRPRWRTSSSRSPGGSSAMTERRALARPPAGPAHPGPLPRVLSASPRRSSGSSSSRCCSPPGSASRSGAGRRSGPRWRSSTGADRHAALAEALDAATRLERPHPGRLRGGRRRSAPATSRWSSCPDRAAASSTATTPTRPDARDGPAPGGRGAAARRRPRRPGAGRPSSRSASAGARYVDFVVPGLLGHEPDGQRHLGIWASPSWTRGGSTCSSASWRRRCRGRQYLASFVLSRLTFLVHRGRRCCWASRVLVFGVPLRGSLLARCPVLCLLSALAFASLGLLLASRARGRSKACPG